MTVVDPFLFRGGLERTAHLQKKYLKYFKHSNHVLDIGSGRGEFLKLLESDGKKATGIDTSDIAIKYCIDNGLTVIKDDIFHFFKTTEQKFDGIFCSHLIEHIPPAIAYEFVELCSEALNPGGVIVFITPNFYNLRVVTNNFWLDLEHVRPYPIMLIREMFEKHGLETVDFGEDKDTIYRKEELQNYIKHFEGISKFRTWFVNIITMGLVKKIKNILEILIELLGKSEDIFVVAKKPL